MSTRIGSRSHEATLARLDHRGGVVRAESTQHAENAANAAAVDELLAAVPIVGTRRSKEVWSRLLRRRFPSAEAHPAQEWAHGSPIRPGTRRVHE